MVKEILDLTNSDVTLKENERIAIDFRMGKIVGIDFIDRGCEDRGAIYIGRNHFEDHGIQVYDENRNQAI